jgi:hypothetical protein
VAVVSLFIRHALNIRAFRECSIAKAAVSENLPSRQFVNKGHLTHSHTLG